jgi:hypothetical protein
LIIDNRIGYTVKTDEKSKIGKIVKINTIHQLRILKNELPQYIRKIKKDNYPLSLLLKNL